jgi:small subunit ribosomal protein S17
MAKKKEGTEEVNESAAAETADAGSVIDSALETVATAVEVAAEAISEGVEKVANAVGGDAKSKTSFGRRAERIGVVSSDKMTKTVVVRVDRLVKHPVYRKYVRKRKKFMAHDEMGSKIGDKVRIVETRPLSARKRWRVVEIIQKAEL